MVEDFESRPHNAVTFLVQRDKEVQELRELQIQKALPGNTRRKSPGRSKAERGKEDKEKIDEVRRVENEVMNASWMSGPIDSTARCDVAAVVEEMENVDRGSGGDAAEERP